MAIHLENEFTVPASTDEVWEFLLDPRRVAPCMPGAELTEVVNDHQYKAKGSEMKGKGQANAKIISSLERNGSGTKMRISQDLDLSGPLAQYGRGMIQDVTGSPT